MATDDQRVAAKRQLAPFIGAADMRLALAEELRAEAAAPEHIAVSYPLEYSPPSPERGETFIQRDQPFSFARTGCATLEGDGALLPSRGSPHCVGSKGGNNDGTGDQHHCLSGVRH